MEYIAESGLRGGFHHNISYDHSECCENKGISPLCRAMCKPSEMDKFHFDPTRSVPYPIFLSYLQYDISVARQKIIRTFYRVQQKEEIDLMFTVARLN